MIAAVYCRKSTFQDDRAAEERSVATQLDLARAYSSRHGWTIAAEHVYIELDGSSGAEFEHRDAFMALVAALKPRAPFDVLILYDKDRLGREQWEMAYYLKKLDQAGVTIHETKDRGGPLRFDSPTDRMMMSMLAGVADLEREKARTRTRDAMERKAARGHVCGGRTFGYNNLVITDEAGRRSHVVRRINEAEAAVIRRLFDLYASGHSYQAIALRLNGEGAPAPKPKRATLPRGWAPSSVREALHRHLYRGEAVWGKTKKRDRWGQKRQQSRDPDTWVRHQDEGLRVVSEEVWQATRQRLEGIRQSYLRWTHGKLWGRPASGLESKYLLTGLGTCAVCGGGIYVEQRTHGHRARRTRAHFYGCWAHRSRGGRTCTNDLFVPMAVANEGIITGFEAQLLDPAVIHVGLETMRAALQAPPDAAAQATLERELETVEPQIAHLTQAIKLGGNLQSLVRELRALEGRRRDMLARLDGVAHTSTMTAAHLRQIEATILERLDDWRGMLRQEPRIARQMLTKLLAGRITFTPSEADGERVYQWSAPCSFDKIVRSGVLSGRGDTRHVEVWWPQGDSNPRFSLERADTSQQNQSVPLH
jgi:site-specific DNA recombinase